MMTGRRAFGTDKQTHTRGGGETEWGTAGRMAGTESGDGGWVGGWGGEVGGEGVFTAEDLKKGLQWVWDESPVLESGECWTVMKCVEEDIGLGPGALATSSGGFIVGSKCAVACPEPRHRHRAHDLSSGSSLPGLGRSHQRFSRI